MNIKKTLLFGLLVAFTWQTQAAMITNGDFQTCSLSGWQTDTDGFGDPGATGDFNVQNNAGECAGQVNVDIASGATAFFANTLFTDLDLSANPGDALLLSFDWGFSGFDDETFLADAFSVFLFDGTNSFGADGLLGSLIDVSSSYGSGTFSAFLDSSLFNQAGWSLDFQVLGGFNQTSFSSTLTIDNVSLSNVVTAVPEPASLGLLLLGLFGVACRPRRTSK